MRKFWRDDNSGFTIIEMIVVLGVGVLFLTGAYFLMIGAISSTRESRNRSVASNLATEKVEELRGLTYSNIPICPNDPPAGTDPATCTDTQVWPPIGGITFTITIFSSETITVSPPPQQDQSQRKDIRVIVRWNDPKAKTFVSETSITPSTATRTPV